MTTTAHVLILTPSLGRVSLGYRDTFGALMVESARWGVKLSVCDATDPGMLVHCRNVLFAAAIDSEATHAFWWDADVAFDPAALLDLLERPEEMICRPYPMRTPDWNGVAEMFAGERVVGAGRRRVAVRSQDGRVIAWAVQNTTTTITDDNVADGQPALSLVENLKRASIRWTAALHFEDGKPVWSVDRALVRVSHCGFGWVLMKTDAMRARFPHFVQFDVHEKDWRDRRVVRAFDLEPNLARVTQGEDVGFCPRWHAHEGVIWAAPFASITNGDRAGCYADHLRTHGFIPEGRG